LINTLFARVSVGGDFTSKVTMTIEYSMHVKDQPLRVIVFGSLAPDIQDLCLQIDQNTCSCQSVDQFFAIAVSLDPSSAILLVSLDINEFICLQIAHREALLDKPICLGFVVSQDHAMIVSQLFKIQSHDLEPIAGDSIAYLDDDLVGAGLASVLDICSDKEQTTSLEERLKTEYGSLFLYGHSNGVCHGAGGLALCIRDQKLGGKHDASIMPCFDGAQCRFDHGTAYKHVDASTINCQLIVDLTCFGYMITDNSFHSKDSLGQALLTSPSLRALVTSVRPLRIDRDGYALAAFLVHDALPMGNVTALLNRIRIKYDPNGAELVCFGDPRAHLIKTVCNLDEYLSDSLQLPKANIDFNADKDISLQAEHSYDEVIVYSNANCAAWSPNGTIYLSLDKETSTIGLSRVKVSSLLKRYNFKTLVPFLIFLQFYINDIRKSPLVEGDQELNLIAEQLERKRIELLEFIYSFNPSITFPPGGVINEEILTYISNNCVNLLIELSENLHTILYKTSKDAKLCFQAGSNLLHNLRHCDAVAKCLYCDSQAILIHKEMLGTDFKRQALFCDRCGPLFEGLGLVECFEINREEKNIYQVTLSLRNPFDFDIPVFGILCLLSFDGLNNAEAEFNPMVLSGKEIKQFCTQISISSALSNGIHRIKAMFTIGAHVEISSMNFKYKNRYQEDSHATHVINS